MIKDFFDRPFTLHRVAKIGFIVLFAYLGIWLLKTLSPILIPFFMAWLFAYMMMPLVRFFQYKCRLRSRILSVIIVLVLVAGVLTGLFFLVWPSIVSEATRGWELIQRYASYDSLKSILPEPLRSKLSEYPDVESILAELNLESIADTVQKLFKRSASILAGTFSLIKSAAVIFIFLLYLIFIMIDYEKLSSGAMKLLPENLHNFANEAGHNVRYYVTNYFKGQSLIALCVGVLLAIGYYIQGLPLGISLGLLIGLFNLVPYLQTVGVIPIVFLGLLHSANTGQSVWLVFLISFGILGLVQLIQDTFLTPKIMGKTMGMRPAVILLSLSIFGYLFGLLGMLFALPATMIIYTYHMKYVVGKPIEEGGLLREKRAPEWKVKLQKRKKFRS